MHVDTRGEIQEKPPLLMVCMTEISIAGKGIDFNLNANYDLIRCTCLEFCTEKPSEAVSRLKVQSTVIEVFDTGPGIRHGSSHVANW